MAEPVSGADPPSAAASFQDALGDAVERRRLEVLGAHGILDTAPETMFDQLVEMAQATFETPVALFSLVDDHRQWFKARIGLEPKETPRDIAFCRYTIRSDEVMVVPDARLDPRFADNPLVTEGPRIRFYAGAPLITPEGARLGALDVISPEPPGGFSAQDRQRLQKLAGIGSTALELRRQKRLARHDADDNALLATELEHRTASSLRLLARVLEAEAAGAENRLVRQAIRGAVDRIAAVEALHHQLRGADGGFGDDARAYLLAMLGNMQDYTLREAGGRAVSLVTEPGLTVPADRLARLGMVMAELVGHAIRHGHGDIAVQVERAGRGIEVSVGDGDPGQQTLGTKLLARDRPGLQIVAMLGSLVVDPSRPGRLVARVPV